MTARTPEHIEDKVLQLRNEWLSIRKIMARIEEELGESIWYWTVQRIIKECRENVEKNIKTPKMTEGDDTKWIVDVKDGTHNYQYHPKTDMYIGKVNGEMIMISRDTVLSIFQDYAKIKKIWWYSALGKSRQEIMFDYDLWPNEWSFLQNNLFLRTNWPNADPVTIMNHEKNGTLEEFETEQAKHQLRNKYQYRVQKKQQQIFERDARKALDIINWFEARKRYVYEKENCDFDFSSPEKIAEFKQWDIGMYNISDLHTWWRDLEETKLLLRNIAQDIIESWYKKIILNINWDMFESAILWWYHRWQIEEMAMHQWTENPIFWDKLVKFTALILENCLIRPIHEAGIELMVHCRAGNHGRSTIESKDDPKWLIELTMYFAIQQGLKDTNVLFEYASSLQPVYFLENFLWFNKVAIAISHWHIKSHLQKWKSIASKYLHQADYVFVIQSHYHDGKLNQESQIKEKNYTETWDRCMLIVTPALCPANTYATQQVIADWPRWFVKIQNNRYNRFNVLFEYVW